MKAIVLCGGNGTRVFPLSTSHTPKQFTKIFDDETLFQKTIGRLLSYDVNTLFLVYPSEFEHHINVGISSFSEENTFHKIIEPFQRNTGAAIYLALIESIKAYPSDDEEYLIVPCDHILDDRSFGESIEKGKFYCDFGITLFGKIPTYPEVGFGYFSHYRNHVTSFFEKPGIEDAKEYSKNGYLWNMGCFLSKRRIFMSELLTHSFKTHLSLTEFSKGMNNEIYKNLDSIPFDKLILEKSKNVYCVEYSSTWSDVGGWNEILKLKNEKIFNSDSDEINILTHYPIKVVKANGVSIIFDDETQSKEIVSLIKKKRNNFVIKKWGWYQILYEGEGGTSLTRKVVVLPGKRTPLQFHKLRSERVNVLSGRGILSLSNEIFSLSPEESILIPGGCYHRIAATGDSELIFIEIQQGICEESDEIIIEDD